MVREHEEEEAERTGKGSSCRASEMSGPMFLECSEQQGITSGRTCAS